MPAIVLAVTAFLAGCTALGREDVRNTGEQLAAAGFDIKLAGSPARRNHLDTLPRHRLISLHRDDRAYYIYADPDWCECLYAGSQADYAAYRRLSIIEEQEDAVVRNADASMDWDLWGPWSHR